MKKQESPGFSRGEHVNYLLDDEDETSVRYVHFGCGEVAARAHIPSLMSRLGAPRCPGCCAASGLPEGIGSPRNDHACRALLGLDQGETP